MIRHRHRRRPKGRRRVDPPKGAQGIFLTDKPVQELPAKAFSGYASACLFVMDSPERWPSG